MISTQGRRTVTESSAAESITNVFVYASGLNIRPACPVSPNTGRNETAMISSEKKMAGVTSRAASASSFARSASLRSFGACSNFLCAASTMTISASTVAPTAMAIPPSDMIVAGIPRNQGMKAITTASGRERIGTARSAVQQEQDDHEATTIISSVNAVFSVSMERSIRSLRL